MEGPPKLPDEIPEDSTQKESIELTLEEKYRIVGKKDSILDMRGVHLSVGYLDIILAEGVVIKDRNDLEEIADAVEVKFLEIKERERQEMEAPEVDDTDLEMGPNIDLLQELKDANEKAIAEDPDYKKSKDGGITLVWKYLSDNARNVWNYQTWNQKLLTSPEGVEKWMEMYPDRKIGSVPIGAKKVKIDRPR